MMMMNRYATLRLIYMSDERGGGRGDFFPLNWAVSFLEKRKEGEGRQQGQSRAMRPSLRFHKHQELDVLTVQFSFFGNLCRIKASYQSTNNKRNSSFVD